MAYYEQNKLKSCLSKANLAPAVYDTSLMRNQKKKFRCRVSVKTFEYIGIGIASNKEQAESLAARDFITHLEYKGLINQSNLPSDSSGIQHDPILPLSKHSTNISTVSTHNPSYQPYYLTCIDRNLESQSEPFWADSFPEESSLLLKTPNAIEKVKDNSIFSVFGSWTLENSKADLHNFAATNGIKLNYSYQQVISKNEWNCILTAFVKQIGREFKALGHGKSKKLSSKACAIELIGQLFHHGLIKPSPSTILERRRKDNEFILSAPKARGTENITIDKEKIEKKRRIGWCPPTPIWDAWLGRETTGLLCKMSLQQISIGLSICNSVLNSPMKVRIRYEQSILPVWNYRLEILHAISKNNVVFICGSTACGKATQVPQFILDDFIEQGDGASCNIIMTQHRPRSAITIAERIAYERCEHFRENSSVGFNIGHRNIIPRPFGAILICTIDFLLKKIEDGLRGISHIIIDELHEPNSNKEFLLNVLRGMIEIHPKLKVIFMGSSFGATAQNYFPNRPIIKI